MRITFTRGRPGRPDSVRCTRPDGTETWCTTPRIHHDLRHFAVESVCGWQRGFFGLVCAGIDIGQMSAPSSERDFSFDPQTQHAETVVAALELAAAQGSDPAETLAITAPGLSVPLDRIQRVERELLAAWAEVAPGDTLVRDWLTAPSTTR